MSNHSPQKPTKAGVAATYAAVSASDTFDNDGSVFIHIKNGGASTDNVVINSVQPCNQGVDHDLSLSVAAGQDKLVGPFETSRFNDPATGRVTLTHSYTTSVTMAVLKAA